MDNLWLRGVQPDQTTWYIEDRVPYGMVTISAPPGGHKSALADQFAHLCAYKTPIPGTNWTPNAHGAVLVIAPDETLDEARDRTLRIEPFGAFSTDGAWNNPQCDDIIRLSRFPFDTLEERIEALFVVIGMIEDGRWDGVPHRVPMIVWDTIGALLGSSGNDNAYEHADKLKALNNRLASEKRVMFTTNHIGKSGSPIGSVAVQANSNMTCEIEATRGSLGEFGTINCTKLRGGKKWTLAVGFGQGLVRFLDETPQAAMVAPNHLPQNIIRLITREGPQKPAQICDALDVASKQIASALLKMRDRNLVENLDGIWHLIDKGEQVWEPVARADCPADRLLLAESEPHVCRRVLDQDGWCICHGHQANKLAVWLEAEDVWRRLGQQPCPSPDVEVSGLPMASGDAVSGQAGCQSDTLKPGHPADDRPAVPPPDVSRETPPALTPVPARPAWLPDTLERDARGKFTGVISTFNALLEDAFRLKKIQLVAHPYPAGQVPEPFVHRGAGRGMAIHEGAHNWRNPAIEPGTQIQTYDRNGSYLTVLGSAELPIGRLQHIDGRSTSNMVGAHRLAAWPSWSPTDLPHPGGAAPRGKGDIWITTPTLKLLDQWEVTGQITGLRVLESWVGRKMRMEQLGRVIDDARIYAISTGDDELVQFVKAVYSIGISTIGESSANTRVWRPDWAAIIRSTFHANMFRAANRVHSHGLTVAAVCHTDELHLTEEPWNVLTQGRRLSDWKLKDEPYTWTEAA